MFETYTDILLVFTLNICTKLMLVFEIYAFNNDILLYRSIKIN